MRIIVSIGDCNGIGIEALVKAIEKFDNESKYSKGTEIAVAGRIDVIKEYTKKVESQNPFDFRLLTFY